MACVSEEPDERMHVSHNLRASSLLIAAYLSAKENFFADRAAPLQRAIEALLRLTESAPVFGGEDE